MPRIGRRKEGRLRVELPAQLITLFDRSKVSLCDLSYSGAQLRCNVPIKIGEQAVLIWFDFETFGRIVWVSDDHVGMEFDEILDQQILLKTREIFDFELAPSEKEVVVEAARNWYLGYR